MAGYKLKTNRAAKKRFKITKNGKILRGGAKTRHILEKKTPKQKRRLGGTHVVDVTDEGRVRKLLPYGG
ncbi:50S ribosomal protein L35 [Leptospira sp. GIMC2001]|uniref:50S ribosomal protein L35 n=1 Tax=Leptospira sp. GIMC2001 TaxID=1513297 RepID=UPI002348F044|nr:50S ribosomal protein L35 [Leptospira sp. GIMC2001]WCL51398.1 50S ribosomal protein L35 [Leptospira sp. GIMC2001]